MGILYDPVKLQKELMNPISSDFVDILKKHRVNPNTIREIAVIDSLSILQISERLYGSYALSSGYNGGGPGALVELLEWTGCTDSKIFDLIKTEKRVHFYKSDKKANWEPINP